MQGSRSSASATKDRILRRIFAQMEEIQGAEVGQRIAGARRQAGLTQDEVADLLNLTTRSYQDWEAGKVVPFRRMDELAGVLKSSKRWLMWGDEMPPGQDTLLSEKLLEAIEANTGVLRDVVQRLDRLVGGENG